MNRPEAMNHDRAAELLPWLVNDSLPAEEKQSVLAHAQNCIVCRRDIAELGALRDGVSTLVSDEDIPAPDMRRINRRIDNYMATRRRYLELFDGLRAAVSSPLRAALVLQSIVIVGLLAILLQPRNEPAEYTTLTTTMALPAGDYVRIVVSEPFTDAEWSALLDRFGLTLADGPSERGVATLAFGGFVTDERRQTVAGELAAHPKLRFAQPVTVDSP